MRLPEAWPVLSWAPFHGGQVQSSCVFNHQNGCFEDNELESIFMNVVDTLDLPSNSVGMITGAEVVQFKQAWLNHGSLWVHAVATVGLGNVRAAGDPADTEIGTGMEKPGTINMVLACNALPDLSGQLEAVQIVSMAKTAALQEAGVVSGKSGKPAAGTGTDCIVIASSGEIETNYCGMHTRLGELIGKAVRRVVSEGVSGGR